MGATHDHLRRKRCLKMEQKVLGHFWDLNLLLIPPDVSDWQMKMKRKEMFSYRSSTTISAQGKLQKVSGPSSGWAFPSPHLVPTPTLYRMCSSFILLPTSGERGEEGTHKEETPFGLVAGAPFSSHLITSNRFGVIEDLNQQNGMIFKRKWCCIHGNWCFLTTWHHSGVVVTGINDLSLCQNTQVTVSTLTSHPWHHPCCLCSSSSLSSSSASSSSLVLLLLSFCLVWLLLFLIALIVTSAWQAEDDEIRIQEKRAEVDN